MKPHKKLDMNGHARELLVARITKAAKRPDIPVMVLHQIAQCIEMWCDDAEEVVRRRR